MVANSDFCLALFKFLTLLKTGQVSFIFVILSVS
jgi:hypothetical protein